VADALAEGSLVELKTTMPKNSRALSIVLHRERRPGRTMQGFIDFCLAGAARP
jgi:hypothetical protein